MRLYRQGDPLEQVLNHACLPQADLDPLGDWIGGASAPAYNSRALNFTSGAMGEILKSGKASKKVGDPNIKGFVIYGHQDQVSGADLDELAELDAAIRLLITELDSQAPAMFPGQVAGQDYVGFTWPWEDEVPVEKAKAGISDAVPGTSPEYQAFKKFRAEYGSFYSSDWNPWFQKNSGMLSSFGAQTEAQLEAYKQRFNQFRERAIKLGIKTDTHEIRNQVKDGSKSGFDKFWESIPWRYVIPVSAVVLLPFYLPVLGGMVYSIFKIKTTGKIS